MGIIKKGSKLYSMFFLKCPKCHEGDLFPTGSFSFQRPFDMYDRCPNCNFNYWPEPGYYYGAMFMSYIISGWFCIGFVLLFHWVFDFGMTASFGLLIGFLAVIFVWYFRFSRAMWLNINYKYEPDWKEREATEKR